MSSAALPPPRSGGSWPPVQVGTWPASTTSVYGGGELVQPWQLRPPTRAANASTERRRRRLYLPSALANGGPSLPLELGSTIRCASNEIRVRSKGDFDTINGNIAWRISRSSCRGGDTAATRFDLTAATEELRVQECSRICQQQQQGGVAATTSETGRVQAARLCLPTARIRLHRCRSAHWMAKHGRRRSGVGLVGRWSVSSKVWQRLERHVHRRRGRLQMVRIRWNAAK